MVSQYRNLASAARVNWIFSADSLTFLKYSAKSSTTSVVSCSVAVSISERVGLQAKGVAINILSITPGHLSASFSHANVAKNGAWPLLFRVNLGTSLQW